jgi:hypothetical protein
MYYYVCNEKHCVKYRNNRILKTKLSIYVNIVSTSHHSQFTVFQHWVGVLIEGIVLIIMVKNRGLELIIVTNSKLPVT